MESRIDQEIEKWKTVLEGLDPEDAHDAELINEGLRIESIPVKNISAHTKAKLESVPKLRSLGMINCKLSSLENLPDLPDLIRLDLSDNNLKGEELEKLSKYPKLEILILSTNQIKSVDQLQFLSKLNHLAQLDLENCPIQKENSYSNKLFQMIPSLQDKDGNEVENDLDSDEAEEEEYDSEDEFIDNQESGAEELEDVGAEEGAEEFEDAEGEEEGDDDGDEEEILDVTEKKLKR